MNGTYLTNTAYQKLRNDFMIAAEGFSQEVYFCPAGIPTIGKGIALLSRDSNEFKRHKENLELIENFFGVDSPEYKAIDNFTNRALAAINGTPEPVYGKNTTLSTFEKSSRGKELIAEFGPITSKLKGDAYFWVPQSSPSVSESNALELSASRVLKAEKELDGLLKKIGLEPGKLTEQQRVVLLSALYQGRWRFGGREAAEAIKAGKNAEAICNILKKYKKQQGRIALECALLRKKSSPTPFIADLIKSLYALAQWYLAPRDPFVLDLDGDGIETISATGAILRPHTGVLFDHDGDGIKTGTGWIDADDGLLVRDLNGDGIINNGAELFGDRTKLASGANAANGFAALRDLDANADGRIDADDAAFSELKVWRDSNQDGVSQADELFFLSDLGIAAINLDAVTRNQAQNGNTIAATGTFTRTDGTTGTTADVNLAIDTTSREFTDSVEIPEAIQDLPTMGGSGRVRDLQEAAALSADLQDVLTRFSAAVTRGGQMALLDELILAWADTSDMAKSLEERTAGRYRVEYLSFGSVSRSSHLTAGGGVTTAATNAEDPLLDAYYRSLITIWNNKNPRPGGVQRQLLLCPSRSATGRRRRTEGALG
jgi:GH24 family phage-related lysozyme (muramidase)